jgi:hypothetical protein
MMKWLRNPDPEKISSSEAAFAYATFVMRSANSNTDIGGAMAKRLLLSAARMGLHGTGN